MKILRPKLFSTLVFLFIALSINAQWTYHVTVVQKGSCIPYPTLGPINYYTKAACEAARNYDLKNNGSDWSVYGDGSCTTVITCTPCSGSDIGGASQNNGIPTPETMNINGLEQGIAIFSSHQSKEIEDWINDYWQRLKALGIPYDLDNQVSLQDVPLTGDIDFDKFYINQMLGFEKSQQGGVVDLSSTSITDGKTVNLLRDKDEDKTLKTTPPPPLPASVPEPAPKIEESTLAKIFTKDNINSVVGLAPPPISYLGIAIVDIYAADYHQLKSCMDGNCESGKDFTYNLALDLAKDEGSQAVGDLGGKLLGKGFAKMAEKNEAMLKGADMGFSELRKGIAEEVVQDISAAHVSLVSTTVNAGKSILNSLGIETSYDDPK